MKECKISVKNMAGKSVEIGHIGENMFTSVVIDVSHWMTMYPEGLIAALYRRPDGKEYPVSVEMQGKSAVWVPESTDLAISGKGYLEIRIMSGASIGKSDRLEIVIKTAMTGGNVPDPPQPLWTDEVLLAGEMAKTAKNVAVSAAGNAENSAILASGYAVNAEDAKMAAETARSSAEESETKADAAKKEAVTAKTDAVEAQQAAEAAKNGAVTAKVEAEAANVGAISAKTAAEAAKIGAEVAEAASEAAAENAGNAADLAVSTHNAEALAHSELFAEKPTKLEVANAARKSVEGVPLTILRGDTSPLGADVSVTIMGNSVQDALPTQAAPQPIRNVGDMVAAGEHERQYAVGIVTANGANSPAQTATQTFFLAEPLRKGDTLNAEYGVVTKKRAVITLDGTKTYVMEPERVNSSGLYSYRYMISNGKKSTSYTWADDVGLCDRYKTLSVAFDAATEESMSYQTTPDGVMIRFRTAIPTAAEFATYMAANPAMVEYDLNAPAESTVTGQKIILLNSDMTVISTDTAIPPSTIKAEYNQNINAALKEIAAAIASLGGVI